MQIKRIMQADQIDQKIIIVLKDKNNLNNSMGAARVLGDERGDFQI